MRDLASSITLKEIAEYGAKTSSVTGTAIDTLGFRSCTVFIVVGTDTDGTHAPTIKQKDASGDSLAAVPAADIFGDSVPADLAGSTIYRFGLANFQRYVSVDVTVAGTTTGAEYGVYAVLGDPQEGPVAFDNA